MESTTQRRKRSPSSRPPPDPAHASGPLSVPLPPDLRSKLATEAKKRNLKMATVARVLLDERMREIDDTERLSRAEEWQRAEAWATWERLKAGDRREVGKADLDADFDDALRRVGARRSA